MSINLRLASLPLFEKYDGERISLDGVNCRILKESLPKEGFESAQTKVTFLKHHSSLQKLYNRIGLKEITELDVYAQYVVQLLPKMSDENLLKHLDNLAGKIDVGNGGNTSVIDKIVNSLKNLAVIGNLGERKLASEFYDHKDQFFVSVFSKEKLLPAAYRSIRIYSLCKVIGLQCGASEDLILDVARELEKSETVDAGKAKFLVRYLAEKSKEWSMPFFNQLATIRFIPSHQVSVDFKRLQEPFNNDDRICFKESVVSSAESLVWTSATLMPYWSELSYNQQFAAHLGVKIQPPVSLVVEHCQNLCARLSESKLSETTSGVNSETSCSILTNVLKNIYTFLKGKKEQEFTCLKDVSCIVVEHGKKLVLPGQISVGIHEDDLKPYLYKIPLDLREFHALFCSLGATERPTPSQFSNVLASVFESSGGKSLNPDERRLASIAVKRFFENLGSSNDLDQVQTLFLMCKSGSLKNANDLIFNDRPKFTDRVKDYNCEEPNFHHLDLGLLQSLPERLRPKFLSDFVEEKLVPDLYSCDPHNPDCKMKRHFERFLTALMFRQGITRLVKHNCSRSGVEYSTEEMKEQLQEIGSIVIVCKPEVSTQLWSKTKVISGSQRERKLFVDECGTIYISHKEEIKYALAVSITEKGCF